MFYDQLKWWWWWW